MRGKLLGAALIVAAALWVFLAQLKLRRQELRLLADLASALESMAASIRWQRRTLPDILFSLQEQPMAGRYFQEILCAIQNGASLQCAWAEVFSDLSADGGVLAALELSGDEERLVGTLTYAAQQLKTCCEERRGAQRQLSRLWLAGTLSAAGLLIILLI